MYDVLVIGGGHAGVEASLASARLNQRTLLVTGSIESIAHMPCNPSVGGPAKGIVVREIDALGGEMGKNIDKSYLQIKMLNLSKGPAVHSLRAQADIVEYPKQMIKTMTSQENLEIIEDYVSELIVVDDKVKGVKLESGKEILSSTVVITTGTYMHSKVMQGNDFKYEGPSGYKASMHLSDNLRSLGIKTFRLKTGTPARIKESSIDYSKTTIQHGDNVIRKFSFDNIEPFIKIDEQLPCYLTYTTKESHEIIKENLLLSSMYSGLVEGTGPRYCPSIETKIERFADKERHQIFLEPESLKKDSIYIQGYSNSMPIDIQERMLRAIPALENCEVISYAYAIEYDVIYSTDLYPSLESKIIKGLFFAGQVNGTSGYEEAAGQGLIAGINAARKVSNLEPLILRRDQAYIGVLIDDLVTKGTDEPYRLLTSRAEFRLLLRHDNADIRLTEIGKNIGLITESRYESFLSKQKLLSDTIEFLKSNKIYPKKDVVELITSLGLTNIKEPITCYDFLKRDEVKFSHICKIVENNTIYEEEFINQLELSIKYEGYIQKAVKESENLKKIEDHKIPKDIDYNYIHNLAYEAKEKLIKIKPLTLGQAKRIPGINPSDIQILLAFLRGKNHE